MILAHVAIAVVIQVVVAIVGRNWWVGALAGAVWGISREITQAEYRWIETFGAGHRANMPWWGGFDPAVWTRLDPWFDWGCPLLAVLAIAAASPWWTERRHEA